MVVRSLFLSIVLMGCLATAAVAQTLAAPPAD